MAKRALASTATMKEALARVESGEWTMEDVVAWDESRTRTVVLTGDRENMGAEEFAHLTRLGKPDEDKRKITIGKDELNAKPKKFSTGSVGYNINGRLSLLVGGKPAKFQFSGNAILLYSKPGEDEAEEEQAPADGTLSLDKDAQLAVK